MGPAEVVPVQLRLVRRYHIPPLHRRNPQRELSDGEAVRRPGPEFADAVVCFLDSQREGDLHHHCQIPDGRGQGLCN